MILPNGTEVNSSNANSFGFVFSTMVESQNDATNIPVTMVIPGTHTLISLAAGQAAGSYQIKSQRNGGSD
jgi:hypothetical protein